MSYAVAVTFRAKPEFRAQFRAAMIENATESRTKEPGCRQFDVCENAEGEIFLYEIYDDEAAFQAHRESPHFVDIIQAQVVPLLDQREVTQLVPAS